MKLFIGYTLLLLVVLLQPFDFSLPFYERGIRVPNGITFTSRGEFFSSSSPNRLYHDLVSGKGMTLEVWATIKINDQIDEDPARIVSYSNGHGTARNFTLGQDGQKLFMVFRDTPDLIIRDLSASGKPQHLVLTHNFSEEQVFIDGQLSQRVLTPSGNFSTWDASYSLVIGNEVTGDRPWVGQLSVVAIYNRALSKKEVEKNYTVGRFFNSGDDSSGSRVTEGLVALYVFTEGGGEKVLDRSGKDPPLDLRLQIPTNQEFLANPFRELTYMPFNRFAIDMIGNIVLFIPFGFLFQAVTKRHYSPTLGIAAIVLIVGTLFTLSIESLQYLLVTRHSSMTDVINNVVGTALGIAIDRKGLMECCKWLK